MKSPAASGGDLSSYAAQGMDYVDAGAYISTPTSFTTAYTAITVLGFFKTTDAYCTLVDLMGGIFDYLARVSISAGYLQVRSANGTLQSKTLVDDGNAHSFFFQYTNGGAFTFEIDSANTDDTGWGSRVVPTTILKTGTNTTLEFGRSRASGGTGNFTGRLGFIGITDTVDPNPTDFFDSVGWPWELDEATWSEWVAQPKWWKADGDIGTNNSGSDTTTINSNGASLTGPTGFLPTVVVGYMDDWVENSGWSDPDSVWINEGHAVTGETLDPYAYYTGTTSGVWDTNEMQLYSNTLSPPSDCTQLRFRWYGRAWNQYGGEGTGNFAFVNGTPYATFSFTEQFGSSPDWSDWTVVDKGSNWTPAEIAALTIHCYATSSDASQPSFMIYMIEIEITY